MTRKNGLIILVLCIIITLFMLMAIKSTEAIKKVRDPLKDHISQCRLYNGVSYKNLTIIPLCGPEMTDNIKIMTLDEALKANGLEIKEISESGSVNSLSLTNRSDQYIFIMAGEILAGAKQDRVLKEDVLLLPDKANVIVNAYCVEHGRWEYKTEKFYSENKTANLSVRQSARIHENQGVVWNAVAETNRRVAAEAPTGSLSKSHEAPRIKENRAEYLAKFRDITEKFPKTNGVIVLINNKVLAADFFSDREIFGKLWPKLLDSYIVEALSARDKEVSSNISSVSDFIKHITDSQVSYVACMDSIRKVKLMSDKITGSGLTRGGSVIHLDVFPRHSLKTDESSPQNRLQRNYSSPGEIRPQVVPVR
jgi:hypothetical protein